MSLIDTGVVIEIIKTKKYASGLISPVTLIEVLRGLEDKKRSKVKQLIEESFPLLNLDNSTIEVYCSLYRKLKNERSLLPDAYLLIAAAAIAHDLKLETNDEHFQRLKALGLKLK